jgi:protein O-GlcNAc transferase
VEERSSNAAILSQLLCASLKRCDWTELEARLLTLSSLTADLPFSDRQPLRNLVIPGVTAEQQRGGGELRAAQHPAERARFTGSAGRLVNGGQDPATRLRIGYLSADYRNHPVGQIMPQVIELHDRSQVEVFGYSMGVDDHSDIRKRLDALPSIISSISRTAA